MMLPKGTIVAVADGEKLNLFRNTGDEAGLNLVVVPHDAIDADQGTSMGRQASSANPDHGQSGEDQFSAGIVQHLNQQALGGKIENLVIVAAPRAPPASSAGSSVKLAKNHSAPLRCRIEIRPAVNSSMRGKRFAARATGSAVTSRQCRAVLAADRGRRSSDIGVSAGSGAAIAQPRHRRLLSLQRIG